MTQLLKHSPLSGVFREKQARLGVHAGWSMADHFGDPGKESESLYHNSVLVDWSHLGKIRLRGPKAETEAKKFLPSDSKIGVLGAASDEISAVLRLTEDEFLVLCRPGTDRRELLKINPSGLTTVNETGALAALVLAGPDRYAVLERSSAMDLSCRGLAVNRVVQTTIHRVPTIFYRSGARDLLICPRELAHFLFDALCDVGFPIGFEPMRTSDCSCFPRRPMVMEAMWTQYDLKKHYDVVIIGGGAHGLATAYYLAKMGIKDVAVLEAKFIGYGGSGRNTAILRSNYRTPEGIRFYDQSLKLYEDLATELDFNLMFSQQGHFTLGHSTSSIANLTTRAENNKAIGVDSYMLSPREIKRLLPDIDISNHPRYPILGALYHPPGGIIRHDAVVWGYARGADRLGVEIHNLTPVEDILVEAGKVRGVVTNRGKVHAKRVLSAVAGWSSHVCQKAGVRLPFVTHPLQALVTEAFKPWLHHVVVSSNLHIYLSQTDRGELVCGNGIDGYPHYGMQSTLGFLEGYAAHVLELFPCLHEVKVQRQWAGLCEMTPDYSPIISPIEEVDGFYVNGGWGTYGFKASAASGYNSARMIAEDAVPDMIAPFAYDRFARNSLVGEKAAASVSN